MFEFKTKQLNIVNNDLYHRFLVDLKNHFQEMRPPYLQEDENKLMIFLDKKVQEGKKFGLKTDRHLEKFIFLALSYKDIFDSQYSKEMKSCLTWPNRNPEEKLKQLHQILMETALKSKNTI